VFYYPKGGRSDSIILTINVKYNSKQHFKFDAMRLILPMKSFFYSKRWFQSANVSASLAIESVLFWPSWAVECVFCDGAIILEL